MAEGESGQVGLAVDAASEVVGIAVSDVAPAPETALTAGTAEAFEGVAHYGDRLIILLDLDKVLPRADFETSSIGDRMEGDDDV